MDVFSFAPKQVTPFGQKMFEIIGADETLTIAKYEMNLLPPFPAGANIHDVACGLGPVTESLLATKLPSSIQIKATDIVHGMKLESQDKTFSYSFLSLGLPIMEDPVLAAKEMYRTLQPGGTAGECAQETRRAVYGDDARLALEPMPQHEDPGYIRSLLFALAIWSAIGVPPGGWTQNDEDTWDTAVAKYKELLAKKSGFHIGGKGNITLEAIAQVSIVQRPPRCSIRTWSGPLDAAVLTIFIRYGLVSTITNPMQNAFAKLSRLDSDTALRSASFAA
ncbi:hypothetical protein PG999_010318 [Apiospora kogelbergensis]|uniref:Methyltransferase domain-containing protein n=1 Tax=Apiospora kogelbergensis TaxID=1337665 RepID=A0AAW0QJP1_9PEZI